jgi:hypothetical protein
MPEAGVGWKIGDETQAEEVCNRKINQSDIPNRIIIVEVVVEGEA